MNTSGNTIAIIGAGPRGLAVAERLGKELQGGAVDTRVNVVLIDDYQPGCGRVWRTDQSEHVITNTISNQVTIFSGPPDGGKTRPGHGPSLYEWLLMSQDYASYATCGGNTCVPRRIYGEYLRYALEALMNNFPALHSLQAVRARVTDVIPLPRDRFKIRLVSGGPSLVADAVVLATGHAGAKPSAEEWKWIAFS